MKSKFFTFSLLGIFLLTCSAADAAPSFDCAKVTAPLEKLICSNNDLAKLDNELADQWQKTLDVYQDDQRASLVKGQKAWLKMRKDACQNDASKVTWPKLVDCVGNIYKQRIEALKQQVVAHSRVPQTDFDTLLDAPANLANYDPKSMSTMRYNGEDDIRFDISYLPQTCRELYTYDAGNWSYTGDTIGSVSESFAKLTCGFNLLSKLNTAPLTKDQEQKITSAMKAKIQLIQDEAEFHEIKQAAFGDFTGLGRREILANVFSSSKGTLHFYSLYLGYYDEATGKFELERIDPMSPFKVQADR